MNQSVTGDQRCLFGIVGEVGEFASFNTEQVLSMIFCETVIQSTCVYVKLDVVCVVQRRGRLI